MVTAESAVCPIPGPTDDRPGAVRAASRRALAALLVVGTVVGCLAALPAARAAADTITLADGQSFTGTVVREDRRNVEFTFDIFRIGEGDRPEPLRVTVPRSLLRERDGVTKDRNPNQRVALPHENASRAERAAAAARIIRQGRAASLDQAQRLLVSLVVETENDGEPPAESVFADLLRFRIVDLVAEWRAADAAERRKLAAELTRPGAALPVLREYLAYLALQVRLVLESSGRRDRLVDQLRHALRFQREDFLRFVARGPGTNDDGWHAEMADRLARLEALARTPASPLALAQSKTLEADMQALLAVLAIIEPFGEPLVVPLRQAVREWTADWGRRLPPALVVGALDGEPGSERHDHNEFVRAQNQKVLERLKANVAAVEQKRLDEEFAVVVAINDYRQLLGLSRLEMDTRLQDAAAAHAQRCLRANRLDHELGGTPAERARGFGWRGGVGENLYRAGSADESAAEVLDAWRQSAEHHLNLLRGDDFRWIGVARRGDVWCLMVGGS